MGRGGDDIKAIKKGKSDKSDFPKYILIGFKGTFKLRDYSPASLL